MAIFMVLVAIWFLLLLTTVNNNTMLSNLAIFTVLLVFFSMGTLIGLCFHVALLYSIKERNFQKSMKEYLRQAWDVAWPYAWVCFLAGIMITIGFALLIIPGIIVMVWLLFSKYIFIWEEKKGMQALQRSRELVKGYWWPIFGRLCLVGVVGALVSSIPSVGMFINLFIVAPFSAIYIYVLYENVKMVKVAPIVA